MKTTPGRQFAESRIAPTMAQISARLKKPVTRKGFGGVGSALYDAIGTRDYALLQGFILMLAIIYVLVNLLIDISYGLLDPRVRVS